jgi:hypothetical protein
MNNSDVTRKKISSSQKELEETLKESLQPSQVPSEFLSEKFSHIAIVAKALKKSNPQQDLKELQDVSEKLEKSVNKVVDVYYAPFNKTIKHFSEILTNLEDSKGEIKGLLVDIDTNVELLSSKSKGK